MAQAHFLIFIGETDKSILERLLDVPKAVKVVYMRPDSLRNLDRAKVNSVAVVSEKEPGRWFLLAVASLAGCISCHHSSAHSISLAFDYDFTETHACSPTLKTNCIDQFNVYDMSTGKPARLFTIPAPNGATGPVKDITGKSQPLNIGAGKRLLAVSAQMSSGEESDLQLCTTWTFAP